MKVLLALLFIFYITFGATYTQPIFAATTADNITVTGTVPGCGDGVIQTGEECDGSALDGQTCQSLGYDTGTLSCDISCSFNVSECANLGPDEGGAVFSGKAYPSSVVKILKDGQIAATTAADSNGDFETTLSHLIVGSYSFAVYAYDSNGNKSKTITYTREIAKDEVKEISDIIVPPTLNADNGKIDKGDKITFSGQTAPLAEITIYLVFGSNSWSLNAVAGSNGYFSYELNTNDYSAGSYTVSAKTTVDSLTSEASEEASFEINDVINDNTSDNANNSANDNSETASSSAKGWRKVDFNDDSRVNLIDFSILIHWFDQPNFPSKVDVNIDKKVNLSDFSVMMYYWSG